MSDLLLKEVTIRGLPYQLHEGKVILLKPINYLFGANGSGKTLVLRKITETAKQVIRSKNLLKDGFFGQNSRRNAE